MSASYHESLDRPLDRVRLLLGDAIFGDDEDAALLSDGHILAILAIEGSVPAATALLADELVARFAQEPSSVGLGGITVSWSARIAAWQALAERMRAQAATATQAWADGPAISGGIGTQGVW